MSFEEIREKPIPIASLRQNWDAEEQKFSNNLSSFTSSMKFCNECKEPLYEYKKEEKVEPQPVTTEEVPRKLEKSEEKIKEAIVVSVESDNVRGISQIGPSTLQPLLRRESTLSTQDSFDDMFAAKPIPPKVETKPEIDIFDPPKKITTVDVKDVFDTSSALSEDFVSPKMVFPPLETDAKTQKKPKVEIEAFDEDTFAKIKHTADDMLAGLPEIDLQTIMNSMGEYSVCLDLDHLRENQSLTDKILEIQAKRDELHTRTLYLTPLYYSIKSAADYYCDAGIICSTGSSREKRVAEIKLRIPEFWKRFSDVIRTKEVVEKTASHLDGQYECISRLITGFQQKNRVGEISRGAQPFESVPFNTAGARIIQTPVNLEHELERVRRESDQEQPSIGKTTPRALSPVDDDLFNRTMSQPVSSKKNFENLDSFESGQSKVSDKTTITGTRETEW